MDGESKNFRSSAKPSDGAEGARRFTRRIDCAPAPAPRPDPLPAPGGHGYPRAPGEGA